MNKKIDINELINATNFILDNFESAPTPEKKETKKPERLILKNEVQEKKEIKKIKTVTKQPKIKTVSASKPLNTLLLNHIIRFEPKDGALLLSKIKNADIKITVMKNLFK
jgi:hypothetical protein